MNPSTFTALRGEGHRSIVVIRNYRVDPITAVSCRAKDRPLGPPSNLFRPRRNPRASGLWWRRRVPPPGPKDLFRRPFIAIAVLAVRQSEYRGRRPPREGLSDVVPLAPAFRCGAAKFWRRSHVFKDLSVSKPVTKSQSNSQAPVIASEATRPRGHGTPSVGVGAEPHTPSNSSWGPWIAASPLARLLAMTAFPGSPWKLRHKFRFDASQKLSARLERPRRSLQARDGSSIAWSSLFPK